MHQTILAAEFMQNAPIDLFDGDQGLLEVLHDVRRRFVRFTENRQRHRRNLIQQVKIEMKIRRKSNFATFGNQSRR